MEHPTQPNTRNPPVDRGSRLWVVGRTVARCLGFEARRWRASHLNQRPTAVGQRCGLRRGLRTSNQRPSPRPLQAGHALARLAPQPAAYAVGRTRWRASHLNQRPTAMAHALARPRPAASDGAARSHLDQRPGARAPHQRARRASHLNQRPTAVGRTPAATTRRTSATATPASTSSSAAPGQGPGDSAVTNDGEPPRPS